MENPSADTVRKALRLLESSRKSAREYYKRNAEAIKRRSAGYWSIHRQELNEKRRLRYAEKKGKAPPSDIIQHE